MWKIWLWIKESVSGVTKNFTSFLFASLLSFATLFLLSVWMIIGLNIEATSDGIKDNLQISMNLKDDVEEYQKLEDKIKNIPEVKSVELITKDEAFERMKNNLGEREELLTDLDFNPLPASFEIKVDDAEKLILVAKEVEGWPESKSVKYGENYVDKLMLVTKNVTKGVYVIIFLIMVVSGLMIFFSVRLSIENRNRELAIKNLVGAGPFNIRIPFILEGMYMTGISALIVLSIIWAFYEKLTIKLTRMYQGTYFLDLNTIMNEVGYKILLIALFIGFFSSLISTHKHIQNS